MTMANFTKRAEVVMNERLNRKELRQYLVEPVLRELGVDCTDIRVVQRDKNVKNKGIVAYYVKRDAKQSMVVDVKQAGKPLTKDIEVLKNVFAADTAIKYVLRTNGVVYQLYTDIVEEGVMDSEPVLEVNLLENVEDLGQLKYPAIFSGEMREKYKETQIEKAEKLIDEFVTTNKDKLTNGIKQKVQEITGLTLEPATLLVLLEKLVTENNKQVKSEEPKKQEGSNEAKMAKRCRVLEIEQGEAKATIDLVTTFIPNSFASYRVKKANIQGKVVKNITGVGLIRAVLDSLDEEQISKLEGVNALIAKHTKYKPVAREKESMSQSVKSGCNHKVGGYYVNTFRGIRDTFRMVQKILIATGIPGMQIELEKVHSMEKQLVIKEKRVA